MQYDNNGYPIKNKNNGAAAAAANFSSVAVAGATPQQPNPQYQREYDGASAGHATNSSPQYDAHGYPVKGQQQQHRQPQPLNNNVVTPQHGGQHYLPANQQTASSPQYDEQGFPLKRQQPNQQQGTAGFPPAAHAQPVGMPAYAAAAFPPPSLTAQPPMPPPPYSPSSHPQEPQVQVQQTTTQPFPPTQQELAKRRSYWSTGLCDICGDGHVCMEVCCCWCCTQGRLYDALEGKSNSHNTGVCCIAWCTCVCALLPITDMFNRRELIHKYDIEGESCLVSALFSCLCPYLSACQMQRELQARGVYPGGVCCAPERPPALKAPSAVSMRER